VKFISLVAPVYNEEDVITHFLATVREVMQELPNGFRYELILVDDGSTDGTHQIISSEAEHDERLRVVTFSRNFGHQAAIAAGLEVAEGDAVVTLDCDLQDPPIIVLDFINKWIDGADLVLGRRVDREVDTWFKRRSAKLFYRFISGMSNSPLESDVADFRLMSRHVVDVLKGLNESSPYWRGLVQWVGFNPVYVDYSRDSRVAGTTKYSFRKMFRLALSGVTSFSDRPLVAVSLVGLLITCLSSLYSIWVIISKLIWPDRSVPGYITAILLTLFLSGVQLLVLGLIGIYVSSVNRNVRKRPEFIIWWDRCKNLETLKNGLLSNSQVDQKTSALPRMN
jgi:glycosyltransferase involved in cell wall biosynthesis